jgi:glycosyltransferase involved in cell wall biosynthesis
LLGPAVYREAHKAGVPLFFHVVGDLSEQWSPRDYSLSLRPLLHAGVSMLEVIQQRMVDSTFTFVQGSGLLAKHRGGRRRLVEAMETTIYDEDVLPKGRTAPESEQPRLLYAGNLIRPKGVHVLLDALAKLHQEGRPWRLTVAGAGPARSELETQADSSGLGDSVDFVGFQSLDGVLALMDRADLFVFPSFGEGMPRVLLEAMARGLPIVATRVGGIDGVIQDGRNGLLVRAGEPDELAAGVRRLAMDARLWEEISTAGLETARAHTMDRYADLMVATLREEGLWT